jgi:hypothetical protein
MKLTNQHEEDVEKNLITVLISGQCSRFIHKDQQVPFFTASDDNASSKVDVCVTLQCGKEAKPGIGDIDSPPYMQDVNVTDIKQWYLSMGANKVQVRILDDNTMDPVVEEITKHSTMLKGEDRHKGESQLSDSIKNGHFLVNGRKRKHRWEIEAHKLYLRHVVYRLAR